MTFNATQNELFSAYKVYLFHNVVVWHKRKMSNWDSCEISYNKIKILQTFRTSSLNLLENMLIPVLRFQAVIHLSAVTSILLASVAVPHASVISAFISHFWSFVAVSSDIICDWDYFCTLIVHITRLLLVISYG